MTPDEKLKMEELEKKVQELEQEIQDRNSQQIQLPLDSASLGVIARALQDAGYVIT